MSEPSSQSNCKCGHSRFRHQSVSECDGHCTHPACGCRAYCPTVVDVPLPADKPCDCGHQVRHLESECAAPTPPYTGGRTPERQALLDACQHPNKEYAGSLSGAGEPMRFRYRCLDCKEHVFEAEEPEPPMTPEEEEEAPEDAERCSGCMSVGCPDCDPCDCTACAATEDQEGVCGYPNCTCSPKARCPRAVPPQPERRPPYAVAYSAAGNLYEVMLPGDATAHAVDGSLVIEHPGSPVLGIVRVLPVRTEIHND